MTVDSPAVRTLTRAEWEPLAAAHASSADTLTAGRRERASRGERHAIEDFLYEYYSTKPAQLARWHPGVGIALEAADAHAGWRFYRTDDGLTRMDVDAFMEARGGMVDYVAALLARTAGRPASFGCFGLHEWAMVYRMDEDDRRHPLPLRLGASGTDAVVESHPIRCSHFDAFRFFTPEAAPLNELQPTRESVPAMEQPGCLHGNMDLYKWAMKLAPAVPSAVTLDAFRLALDVRQVDMQASPYDVSSYGLEPIAIETPVGKREYVERQREFSERGGVLRERLLGAISALRAAATA
ncbi:3-methyladenine DNA glycosylase [Demequina zhanjiangensis]|uniref:3-methyladenine DNA glycosylase n=1 Tax=Demequina zhanjiangensis TaxID=3051659 RepID=A0ABT8G2V7_9MICO|nr:3-methyladenine DNA glycosylase [Demequina sp. SYSU T00b26]MDN4473029.1 3-methyladenine DNA glycosylase [Demequina sp. SYSU T00b26]